VHIFIETYLVCKFVKCSSVHMVIEACLFLTLNGLNHLFIMIRLVRKDMDANEHERLSNLDT